MQNQFKKLISIIDKLRSKNGCTWDRKQNLRSIRDNIIEEAYETVEAINNNDYQSIKEEAGDLLVQAVFISRIAEDKNKFNINDVVNEAIDKLIRRHPHVFDDHKANNTKQVLANWESIKRAEKKEGEDNSILSNIPDILPALLKAKKVQNKAERSGFKWDSVKSPIKKLKEELKEFISVVEKKGLKEKIEEEFGDILFTLVSIGRFYKISPEAALNRTIGKFKRRFNYIEQKLKKDNRSIKEFKLSGLVNLWKEAKCKREVNV